MAAKNQQPAIPQQQKGGGVPKGKPKAAAPDGKNRRALGDIGNLVTAYAATAIAEGKPLPQISRPITRSFGARLLANAQAGVVAVAANEVVVPKPVPVAGNGAARKGRFKEVKPKVTVKPKPEEVTDISTDTEVVVKPGPASKKTSRAGSSRKKVVALTSVLTARAKVACGVTDKYEEPIPNIDSSDAGDQLAVVEYVEDLYKFYKLTENASRPRDYMHFQSEINEKMRAILTDWLIDVHLKFELTPEALYLTMYIIDLYLSKEKVLRKELQLVGVSSMLIASKYEEIWAPEVEDFIIISDMTYSREQILGMEKLVLNKIEWSLTVPTLYVFLVRFVKAAMSDKEMEHMVFFYAELSLLRYSMIKYCPSMVAASAVYAARCTLKKSPLWTETLKRHTGFTEPQLLECSQALLKCHSEITNGKLKAVYKKYSCLQYGFVATHSPVEQLVKDSDASSSTSS